METTSQRRSTSGFAIATAGWWRCRRGCDDRLLATTAPRVQLRAMATAPEVRGHGAGDVLLDAGITRARATAPDAVVWARARDTALGFYVRHGFEVVEPGFVDETTALPHHVIMLTPR